MPILPNAKKALRASQRKQKVNQKIRSRVKNTRKKIELEPTQENLEAYYSAVDKAVKKNVYHANKGARLKSQAGKILAKEGESEKSSKKSKSSKKKASKKKKATKKKPAKKKKSSKK
jgi:ribosomal protein S20